MHVRGAVTVSMNLVDHEVTSPRTAFDAVLNVVFYGLPIEELQTFRERVNAVTVDDGRDTVC